MDVLKHHPPYPRVCRVLQALEHRLCVLCGVPRSKGSHVHPLELVVNEVAAVMATAKPPVHAEDGTGSTW